MLPDFFSAAKTLDMLGFNVTMPLKQHIIPYLDVLDILAERCGAVNTVLIRNGKFIGCNTDGEGFIASLNSFKPDTALILGHGGAAKAVAEALKLYGTQVHQLSLRTEWEDLSEWARHSALIVNATPLGMSGCKQFKNFKFLDHTNALIYDLVYNPRETELLAAASERGLKTLDGIALLTAQAVLAFEKFTGKRPNLNKFEI
jgi:shikimate dehydrogenase